MHHQICHHGQAATVETDLAAFLVSGRARETTALTIGTAVALGDAAVADLCRSALAGSLRELTLLEVALSPEALSDLLDLPSLISLAIVGGAAQDGGADAAFPTLDAGHFAVLLGHPGTARLGRLALPFQNVTDAIRASLRQKVGLLDLG